MTKRRKVLTEEASNIVRKIQSGNFGYIDGFNEKPFGSWPEVINELSRLAPGFTDEEYEETIRRQYWNAR